MTEDPYVIRRGAEEDFPALYHLLEKSFHGRGEPVSHMEMTYEDFVKYGTKTDPSFYTLVAEYRGPDTNRPPDSSTSYHPKSGPTRIIGCVLYNFLFSFAFGNQQYIQGLYIESEHRGKGLGLRLAKAAIEGEARDCFQVIMIVPSRITASMKIFKEHLGGTDYTDDHGLHLIKVPKQNLPDLSAE